MAKTKDLKKKKEKKKLKNEKKKNKKILKNEKKNTIWGIIGMYQYQGEVYSISYRDKTENVFVYDKTLDLGQIGFAGCDGVFYVEEKMHIF
jgi:hypothetical protein